MAFEGVWHAYLWATMKKYNISANLIRVIKHLYNKATSAVIFKSSIRGWFRKTVGVRQGCILSPTLFNIMLEIITTDALDHEGTVSIGARTITNLRFADDIDGLAGEEEVAKLVERLHKASTAYGMEISAEKTTLMTNNIRGISKGIKTNGQKLGSVVPDEGSKPETLFWITQTTAALTRLKPVWNDRSVSLSSMVRLMRSLVISTFLYAYVSLTLTAELQRRT